MTKDSNETLPTFAQLTAEIRDKKSKTEIESFVFSPSNNKEEKYNVVFIRKENPNSKYFQGEDALVVFKEGKFVGAVIGERDTKWFSGSLLDSKDGGFFLDAKKNMDSSGKIKDVLPQEIALNISNNLKVWGIRDDHNAEMNGLIKQVNNENYANLLNIQSVNLSSVNIANDADLCQSCHWSPKPTANIVRR